jgi:hypothetical protein
MRVINKPWILSAIAILFVFVSIEIAARLSGLGDVPLYDADNEIGFLPKPNQSGAFLRRYDWAFNELSMATPRPFKPSKAETNILLIGDSIVLGGNVFSQKDRLGSVLERETGQSIWPYGGPTWGFQNELTYLRRHPEVVAATDAFVFVLNNGNFAGPRSWQTEMRHPTYRPIFLSLYLFKRYVLKIDQEPLRPEMEVARRDQFEDFRTIFSPNSKPILMILYPRREEVENHQLHEERLLAKKDMLKGLDAGVLDVVDLAADPRWTLSMYQDDIHPTIEGTRILADVIKTGLLSNRLIAARR